MSTFLSIAQKVNTLSGNQSTIHSVATATGMQATVLEIVKQAWLDIQNLRKDWEFLRSSVDIITTAGKSSYSQEDIFGAGTTSNVGEWRYILTSPDNIELKKVSTDYYAYNQIGTLNQRSPYLFTYDKQTNTFYINPPDGTYTLFAHYYRKPQVLEADTDVPDCPTEFHSAILYRALVDLGAFFNNSALYQTFSVRADTIIGSMMRAQIPSRRINPRGGIV